MSAPRLEPGLGYLLAEWPAPPTVRACTTLRQGGVSQGGYASLNLADHVGDDPRCVEENRRRLRADLQLDTEPVWLRQVHGNQAVEAAGPRAVASTADASYSDRPGVVCAVLTADCLPLLLCDTAGSCVAAVHAGWRGLLGGVIEAAVQGMHRPGRQLLAWLGPAIGPAAFEVGEEVRRAYLQEDQAAAAGFRPTANGRWMADIYVLARRRLARLSITAVYGGHWCTLNDQSRFYSYRRTAETGRMASLVWRV